MGRELLILRKVLERPRTLRRHEWGWQALELWVWQEAQILCKLLFLDVDQECLTEDQSGEGSLSPGKQIPPPEVGRD